MKLAYQILEKVTRQELNQLEKIVDRFFKSHNVDVEFTKHFYDRVNDPRNIREITVEELAIMFNDVIKKHGRKIGKMDDSDQAVIKDLRGNVNMPFVIRWNNRTGYHEMIAKTVMRKKNFLSTTPFLKVGE